MEVEGDEVEAPLYAGDDAGRPDERSKSSL